MIQYYQDSFSKDVFPIASIEESQSVSPSSLELVCTRSAVAFGAHMVTLSGLGLIFPLDRNKGQPNNLIVSFRTDKAEMPIKFTYSAEHTGVDFVASPDESKKLASLFAQDPKGSVSFRVADVSQGFQPISKQGQFSAAGFDKSLSIMTSYCKS